jgi:hypothetical protein
MNPTPARCDSFPCRAFPDGRRAAGSRTSSRSRPARETLCSLQHNPRVQNAATRTGVALPLRIVLAHEIKGRITMPGGDGTGPGAQGPMGGESLAGAGVQGRVDGVKLAPGRPGRWSGAPGMVGDKGMVPRVFRERPGSEEGPREMRVVRVGLLGMSSSTSRLTCKGLKRQSTPPRQEWRSSGGSRRRSNWIVRGRSAWSWAGPRQHRPLDDWSLPDH